MAKVKRGAKAHLQGKAYESEIMASLKWCKEQLPKTLAADRFHDTRDYVAINKSIKVPHQAADFYAVYDGDAYFLEAKSSRADKYRASYVKDTQIESLLELEDAGAHGILLMCHRVPRKNETYALNIKDFCELKVSVKGGLPWSTIAKRATKVPLMKGKIWDLRPMFMEGAKCRD